jgi:hypothetical protein
MFDLPSLELLLSNSPYASVMPFVYRELTCDCAGTICAISESDRVSTRAQPVDGKRLEAGNLPAAAGQEEANEKVVLRTDVVGRVAEHRILECESDQH